LYVGRRIAKLRAAHGESLRDAALRTGVSHTTIARIEKGAVTGSFHTTLLKIADGYGVRAEFLLTGRDPRQGFELAIRRLAPEDRSRLYFVSPRTRIKMVLDFLFKEYSHELTGEQLADAIGIDAAALDLLRSDVHTVLTPALSEQIASSLAHITGISPHWFTWGTIMEEETSEVPRESITAYLHLIRRAAEAGIQPSVLDMAIELMIMNETSIIAVPSPV
jgi:transcriptional regulator with XRE-family HTH domain